MKLTKLLLSCRKSRSKNRATSPPVASEAAHGPNFRDTPIAPHTTSKTSLLSHSPQSRLLSLPRELRDMIYLEVMDHKEPVIVAEPKLEVRQPRLPSFPGLAFELSDELQPLKVGQRGRQQQFGQAGSDSLARVCCRIREEYRELYYKTKVFTFANMPVDVMQTRNINPRGLQPDRHGPPRYVLQQWTNLRGIGILDWIRHLQFQDVLLAWVQHPHPFDRFIKLTITCCIGINISTNRQELTMTSNYTPWMLQPIVQSASADVAFWLEGVVQRRHDRMMRWVRKRAEWNVSLKRSNDHERTAIITGNDILAAVNLMTKFEYAVCDDGPTSFWDITNLHFYTDRYSPVVLDGWHDLNKEEQYKIRMADMLSRDDAGPR